MRRAALLSYGEIETRRAALLSLIIQSLSLVVSVLPKMATGRRRAERRSLPTEASLRCAERRSSLSEADSRCAEWCSLL